MADVLRPLLADATGWARDAAASGWLPDSAPRTLDDAVVATPAALFEGGGRPLVAALFGGTGVGKSTLMNRLAGEAVARASAERPTSRDVTLYAHRSVVMANLADVLPTDRVRTTLHGNEEWRDVLWLDMPDVDSVEIANRELVMRWLPHVDALVYVVSPERYRDDEGWRLLLEHGTRHAWLFVVNHWDRGDERQVDDFRGMLVAAGLEDPLLFRTDSGPEGDSADDFDALRATLATLADRQLVEQLETRGVLQRVRALRERAAALHARLGDDERLDALSGHWERRWATESSALEESLGWRAEAIAEAIGARRMPRQSSLLARLTSRASDDGGPNGGPDGTSTGSNRSGDGGRDGMALLDAEALARIDDVIERFVQQASARADDPATGSPTTGGASSDEIDASPSGALPLEVGRRLLGPRRAELAERLPRLVDDALARSLAAPGSRVQRFAHRLCGALAGVLPLAAMLWIGWRVVGSFGRGADDPTAYLGSDFAVNGALLLALSWLLPLFLQFRLAPSHQRAAARGLKAGAARALEEVRHVVGEAIETARREWRALEEAYAALWNAAPGETTNGALPERVRRMLFERAPGDAQSGAGVRASTQSSTESAPVS